MRDSVHDRVDGDLEFVEGLLARHELPAAEGRAYRAQLDAIRARRDDPSLYLAVVGEFSSGKSTFVNALLRDPLLHTSAMISTAVATELRAADEIGLEVRLGNARTWLSAARNHRRLAARVEKLIGGEPVPSDMRGLLHLLTSEERVAASVGRVRVHHPGPLLEDDVVVIDTPGLATEHERHSAITAKVVRDEADAFIVVVPSTVPLSRFLVEFLNESLGDHLDRCVFVVTKMSHIAADEREQLLSVLRRRIAAAVDVEDSVVVPCSVGVVMKHLRDPASVPPDERHWFAQFEEVEGELRERLRRERDRAIAARLRRLLEGVFAELEDSLGAVRDDLAERRAALDATPVAHLGAFAEERLAAQVERIEGAARAAQAEAAAKVTQRNAAAHAAAGRKLVAATTRDELQTAATEALEELTRHRGGLQRDLRRIAGVITREATELAAAFDAEFEEAYAALGRLRGGKRADVPKQGSLPAFDAGSAGLEAIENAAAQKDGNAEAASIGIGVVIGTIVFPGLGSVIGGVAGAWLAEKLGPTADQLRPEYAEKVETALDRFFDEARRAATSHVTATARAARTRLEERMEGYVSAYEPRVRELIAEQKAQQKALARNCARLESDVGEVTHRLGLLRADPEPVRPTGAGRARAPSRRSAPGEQRRRPSTRQRRTRARRT